MIKYFSSFTGIGGFELGINQAHEILHNAYRGTDRRGKADTPKNKRPRLVASQGKTARTTKGSTGSGNHYSEDERPLCVGFSEIDPYAAQIYQKKFPTHKNYGDITKIKETELPDFDIFVGGFPCQSFSVAGKRKGFADTRGTLFFDIARILRAKQPRLFLLENVKGLLSHDNGKTFGTIIATLTELGYDLQWQVLNSKDFGVPQNRERVFIVGHIRGGSRPQVFPFGESNGNFDEGNKKGSHATTSDTITARYGSLNARGTHILKQVGILGKDSEATRVYDPAGIARTIKNGGGMGAKTGLYELPSGIRRLTPRECERLQGFPDDWTEYGLNDRQISDSQRYKCVGNAVTVKVVQAIMEKMLCR